MLSVATCRLIDSLQACSWPSRITSPVFSVPVPVVASALSAAEGVEQPDPDEVETRIKLAEIGEGVWRAELQSKGNGKL